MSFGSGRGTLQFGRVTVTIPKSHRPGSLESPAWYRFEFSPDPNKHVVLAEIRPLAESTFVDEFKAKLGDSAQREALVFVHGYNSTFEDAARRTAQLTVDLSYPGPTAFFSWPSQGTLLGYTADEAVAEYAIEHLREFLLDLITKTGVTKIHVLAHSMGGRVLTAALRGITDPAIRNRIGEVILAAPDIDADVFSQQIVPGLQSVGARITLYASSEDKALKASEGIHAAPRAGESGDHLVVVNGVETIDASKVDTDSLGHGYFAENKEVIDDLFMLLKLHVGAVSRNLKGQSKGGALIYWVLP